jgi:serine/threonine protein phosphatase PrpC
VAGGRFSARSERLDGQDEKHHRAVFMSLELLDQLSLPGDIAKPNEDAFAHMDHAALVLDGATPLGPSLLPGPSDAAWIAQFGARRLAAHLKDGDAPQDALKHALADAEKSFTGLTREPIREKWQTPCASMMIAAEQERDSKKTEMEFLWFGDCAAIIAHDGEIDLVGEALEKRQAEAARARMVAQMANMSATAGINRPQIEPLLRAARNRINSGRNWLFSPDRRAAGHASRQTLSLQKDALLLIASDGFLALVSDYGAYDTQSLMAAAQSKGLAALGEQLREIEGADALGEKFPRFKKSDDATALLMRVG